MKCEKCDNDIRYNKYVKLCTECFTKDIMIEYKDLFDMFKKMGD